jgi:hypothetical protein
MSLASSPSPTRSSRRFAARPIRGSSSVQRNRIADLEHWPQSTV